MQNKKLGTLYVVATPIGNLQDITLRAIETFRLVDQVAAEDTRHASRLLSHFQINKPLLAVHNFNERELQASLIASLQAGESIALISDAGTPLINDPGFVLVRACRQHDLPVVPIPGACAAIAALSAAGLPTDRFSFQGFLAAKTSQRQSQLQALLHATETLVFYEAPHRLLDALADIATVFGGDREIIVARELTKLYESFISGTAQQVSEHYLSHPDQVRGEIVLLIKGNDAQQPANDASDAVLKLLLAELPLKKAVSLASQITGERKNALYEKALAWKDKLD